MQNNKFFALLTLAVLTWATAYSQQEVLTSPLAPSKGNALVLYVGGGLGYFPSNAGAPAYLRPELTKIYPVTTARLMWKPDHRVKAGFETGFVNFYSYKLTDADGNKGRIALNAIPILLEFSVAVKKHFHLYAGPGIYILQTNLDYERKTVSSMVSTGWMAAAAYSQPISKDVALGAELKWLYAAETIKGSFSMQVQAAWRFWKW